MINKQKLPLYIALAVPVLMIILVAAFIYMPGAGKHPKYNFLYMTGNSVYDYGYGSTGYQVSGGRLIYTPPAQTSAYPPVPQTGPVNFYLYDVAKGQATEVTLAQAQMYTLDPTNSSPDGYFVQQGNSGGGDFLFGGGGGDYNSWYIKGNNRAVKLNLKLTGSAYSNFKFLGWEE
ncbi:MAG: hypothetical protein P4L74_01375 [Candidatus Doudnabacteria bacterium]|nr:hypothetical protein [Candidatus Doudnabacteria bacterium]